MLTATVALAVPLWLASCSNDSSDLIPLPPMPGTRVSLRDDVQPIFNMNCAFLGCHGGGQPAEGLSLEESNIFDPQLGLVGVTSNQSAPRLRVKPGSAEASYLINKLDGTQASVGGGGDRMPQGGPVLDELTIQVIRDWIDQGAQDN